METTKHAGGSPLPNPAVKASTGTTTPGERPPELEPRRGPGRPRGSASKPREPAVLSARTVAAAYQGLWLIARFATWLLAGRAGSPIAQATGARWTLSDLAMSEAEEDARELLPVVRELPPGALSFCTWIGAPVLLAKRIAAHVTRRPSAPPADAGPERPAA